MEYMVITISVAIVLLIVVVWYQLRKDSKSIAAAYSKLDLSHCDKCDSTDCQAYTFFTLTFLGIAPLAYVYRTHVSAHSLCPQHARETSYAASLSTGLRGHWGFPGCVAATWYVMRNLLSLAKAGSLTLPNALASVTVGIFLGWVLLLGAIFTVLGGCGLYFAIHEKWFR